MLYRVFSLCLVLGFAVIAGCGPAGVGVPLHPATGKVTYEDGTPLPAGGAIALVPADASKLGASGEIQEGGTFTLYTMPPEVDGAEPEAGAPAGKYKVTVTYNILGGADDVGVDPENPDSIKPGEEPKATSPVAAKYSDAATSGLEVTVKEGENMIELKVSK